MADIFLPSTGVLGLLDEPMRSQLNSYGSLFLTQPDQIVIEQGKPNKRMYIVLEGQFHVSALGPNGPIKLEDVSAGDSFGEIALFDSGDASATVTSVSTGCLWFTDPVLFKLFLFEKEVAGCAFLMGICTLLSKRMRSADQLIKNNKILPSFLKVRRPRTAALPQVTSATGQ